MRTCVGCRREAERAELLRLVVSDDGAVAADLSATAFGRGAWVHARSECIQTAARNLGKTLKAPVHVDAADLFRAVQHAADRRVGALLGSARASGKLAVGTDAVAEAIERGRVVLALVAGDARSSASSLPRALASKAAVWGDKARLGGALGRGETGVVAVLDAGFADAIRRSIALSALSAPGPEAAAGGFTAHVEVR